MVVGVLAVGRSVWLGFDPVPGWDRWWTTAVAALGVALLLVGAVLSAE